MASPRAERGAYIRLSGTLRNRCPESSRRFARSARRAARRGSHRDAIAARQLALPPRSPSRSSQSRTPRLALATKPRLRISTRSSVPSSRIRGRASAVPSHRHDSSSSESGLVFMHERSDGIQRASSKTLTARRCSAVSSVAVLRWAGAHATGRGAHERRVNVGE